MTVRTVGAGIIAGLIGGVLLEAFLILVVTIADREPIGATAISAFQFLAAGAVGKAAAFSSPAYAWIGVLVHFVISCAWALAFAYVAQKRPNVNEHPVNFGLVFGFMVWFLTQLTLIGAGLFQTPTPRGLEMQLIAYCVFFGVPVAYTVARLAH